MSVPFASSEPPRAGDYVSQAASPGSAALVSGKNIEYRTSQKMREWEWLRGCDEPRSNQSKSTSTWQLFTCSVFYYVHYVHYQPKPETPQTPDLVL